MEKVKGNGPRDSSALQAALRRGTMDEFEAVYDPSLVRFEYTGGTLLTKALTHSNLENRVTIANRLLDDGVDVHKFHPLHVLLGANSHDFEREPALLERMLDMGADVNELYPPFGTPLETIARKFKFSDATLRPFYDVLLARPDIDLLGPGQGSRPVLVNLRKWYDRRGELVERTEALLTERGIPLPGPAT